MKRASRINVNRSTAQKKSSLNHDYSISGFATVNDSSSTNTTIPSTNSSFGGNTFCLLISIIFGLLK